MFGVRRHRGIYSAALRSALRPPPAPRRCWAAAEVGPRDAPGRWGPRGLSGAGLRAPPEEGWERPRADGSPLEDEPKVEQAKAPAVGVAGYSSSISRWYNAPSTTTVAGRESLVQGLRTNVSICVVKGAVWCGTGSHVIFADWMHSIADVANYSYRLIELNRSAKQRDREHPYGYAPLRYITADRSFVFLGLIGGVYPISIGLGELYGGVTMCESVAAPMAVFVASALLEGVAVHAAYREILSQSEHERIGAEHTGDGPRRVLRYLQEGRDVMSTATFTEASCGILSAGIGLLGLGASWYLHSGVPDVVASIVMAGMVCGVSSFLLRKSGYALLGPTLPDWRVQELVRLLTSHDAVVYVLDVKTEMVGTDTVRFKAEVQFNPKTITNRMLLASYYAKVAKMPDAATLSTFSDPAHTAIAVRMQEILDREPDLEEPAAVRLSRTNGIFYEALAWELKDAEQLLRAGLQDFRHVHIDLEPWHPTTRSVRERSAVPH